MTVFRNKFRGNRWRYDFRASGVRYQGYCVDPATGDDAATKHQARECEALVKRSVRREGAASRSIARPDNYTLMMALAAHIDNQPKSSPEHVANLRMYARDILDHFGHDIAIADVDQGGVDGYRNKAAAAKAVLWRGGPRKRADMPADKVARLTKILDRARSAASTNHYLDCLRAALTVAHRTRDPVTGAPLLAFPPEVKPLPTPRRQPKPMPDAELYARLASAPPWVVDAAELARHFGLRLSEALRMTVANIDRERRALRLDGATTKSGRDEIAPPIAGGWALLMRLERQARARDASHLVTWPGVRDMRAVMAGKRAPKATWRPLKTIRRAWRATAGKAGLAGRQHRFHDVRARYVTEVAKSASSAMTQEAARHADPVTTGRYTAIAASEVARAVRSVPRPKKAVLRVAGQRR